MLCVSPYLDHVGLNLVECGRLEHNPLQIILKYFKKLGKGYNSQTDQMIHQFDINIFFNSDNELLKSRFPIIIQFLYNECSIYIEKIFHTNIHRLYTICIPTCVVRKHSREFSHRSVNYSSIFTISNPFIINFRIHHTVYKPTTITHF